MSASLKLSHNELLALLKNVFQGRFGHSQDWGALADSILWLETRGCGGVGLLIEALEADVLRPFDGVLSARPQGYHVDFKDTSLLMGLPAIVDLVAEYVCQAVQCEIVINNAAQAEALIAAAGALIRMGFSARVEGNRLICTADLVSSDHDCKNYERAYQKSLQGGIIMIYADYDTLTKIAEQTLVKASEASRRGAGE